MLEARELDLELALVGARALREDVEDEVGAVVDLRAGLAAVGERLLEIAHLRGGERLVEDDDLGVARLGCIADLVHLAGSGEGRGIGTRALSADHLRDMRAGAFDEACRFVAAAVRTGRRLSDFEADEDGARALRNRACAQSEPSPAWPGPRSRWRACRPSGHRVFQEHDVLVERFDLALQLDAVHQVDRDRYMLLAQRVEERVL
jgi:hypothetical protein